MTRKEAPAHNTAVATDNIDALLNRPHPETIRETWVNDNAAETPQ